MSTLRGLTTMVLTADDVEEAVAWYSGVLGIAPYFRQPPDGDPAYIEFRIGPGPVSPDQPQVGGFLVFVPFSCLGE